MLEEARKRKNAKQRKKNKEIAKFGKRQICGCQALVHEFLNNCTGCGRIICENEGDGECLF